MRAVVQRVRRACVAIGGDTIGEIGGGLCVLIGAGEGDGDPDVNTVVDKIANLRIFADEADKMNLSVLDVGGEVLAISQFTLYGDTRKGRRPSFNSAMKPPAAETYYQRVVDGLRAAGVSKVATGQFGADMLVTIENDGPVTILIDSSRQF